MSALKTQTIVETWRPISGFQGYEVSSFGRVRSLTRYVEGKVSLRINHGRILKQCVIGRYRAVSLRADGRKVTRSVHTLVAEAFLGPRPPGFHVCHNDGDPCNNAESNLRYDTPKANCADIEAHGRRVRGEAIPWAVLSEADVLSMRAVHKSGLSVRKTAELFGVSAGAAYKALRGLSWRHI